MRFDLNLIRWLDALASFFGDVLQWWRTRKSLVVRREGECFVVRRALEADGAVVANVAVGTRLPSEIAQTMRSHSVIFELPANDVALRRIRVPAQARDFLAGIVRNQIERLSPWPLAKAVYGFNAEKSADEVGVLDVRVSISSRKTIDEMNDQLTASGLAPHQIVVRTGADGKSPAIVLWTRPSPTPQRSFANPRQLVAASIAAVVLLSAGTTSWALYSATTISADRDDVATRERALRQRDPSSGSKESSASLRPAERAWAMKESAPAAVYILEALTRALPDDAYLTELTFEHATLRIVGFAADAPSLIAALEQSKRFSGAHFFAATTKDAESGLYRFNIEAQIAPGLELVGD